MKKSNKIIFEIITKAQLSKNFINFLIDSSLLKTNLE